MTVKRHIFIGRNFAAVQTTGDGVNADGVITIDKALDELGLQIDDAKAGWYDADTKEFLGLDFTDPLGED